MRQAHCSVKLKNFFKLEEVLEKLRDMRLDAKCLLEREDLEVELKKIAELPGKWHQEDPHDYKVQNILVHPKKGRYMTAWRDYQKDDMVLYEKAFAFVPVNEARNCKICSNCAKQQFIPYPCYVCSKVVYCSPQCKLEDEKIHKYECFGHRCDLYESLGVTYFAMHTLLRGLPEYLPQLANCSSGAEIWQQIETIGKSRKKGYPEILALYNNIHLLSPNSIQEVVLGSFISAHYLVSCTTFPELYSKSTCTKSDWLAIISALILRHAVQMIGNAQGASAVNFMDDSYAFQALADIWTQPHHLKRGMLHGFRDFCINMSGIFPYLSLCNHSCDLSLRVNFDGNRLIAKTQCELKAGDEICNSYVLECRINPKSNRQQDLKMLYHFECDCKHCTPKANDEEFLKFHKYRCENSKCNKMFSPPIGDDLQWWLHIVENPKIALKCSFCKSALKLDWFIEFDELFNAEVLSTAQLMEAVRHFKYAEERLYSIDLRQYMAYQIVNAFFNTWKEVEIEDVLFKEITEVIKSWLDYIEEQNDVESLMYATTTPYALDLMAEGNFIDFDRKKIRRSFDMLSTEMRIIFENYIKDYIGEKFDDYDADNGN
ncbi:SET and MYND domain-containing protein 4 isoform X2 [Eupeodes corollae]|nr:SET and MYND domain-containing protein 4 isoform X2 [Eupeodes corollae]